MASRETTPRIASRATLAIILGGLMLVAVAGTPSVGAAANGAPVLSPIEGNFVQSEFATYYTAQATDPDNDLLNFTWSHQPPTEDPTCNKFEQLDTPATNPNSARWKHGGEADGCSHTAQQSGPYGHLGRITVFVTDGHWNCSAQYYGSANVNGDADNIQCSAISTSPPSPTASDTGGVCETTADGWFEPVQAVWQDDPFWPDKVGKRILKPPQAGNLIAELRMIANKPSLLFGVIRPAGEVEKPGRRYKIVIHGETRGTTPVPVKMRFRLNGQEIYTSPTLAQPPFDPPCGALQPYTVELAAPEGIPPPSKGTFSFPAGFYTLENELVREDTGADTGLKVTVKGEAVTTKAPVVDFYPVTLTPATAAQRRELQEDSDRLARESAKFIPDFFPLAPGSWISSRGGVLNMTSSRKKALDDYRQWLEAGGIDPTRFQATRILNDITAAEITKRLGLAMHLGQSDRTSDRAVMVLRTEDVKFMDPRRIDGLAFNPKVVLARDKAEYSVVAHEIAHTLPFIWLSDQEEPCGPPNYHNTERGVANGFRVTKGGEATSAARSSMDRRNSFMEIRTNWWSDQCTYWHLTEQLLGLKDPPVLLVQGRVASIDTQVVGELFPSYRFDGEVDLAPGTGGDYAVLVKDAVGETLERFPFDPHFLLARHPARSRSVASFAFRLPVISEMASIEFVGPTGVLDTRIVSTGTPTIAITAPGPGAVVSDNKVTVSWSGTDPDGDPLLYTVLYSNNEGDTWAPIAVETEATAADITLGKGSTHLIEVVATDGVNSTLATVTVTRN